MPDERWLIADQPNAAVFTTRGVIDGTREVARIIRDDEGDWQAIPPGTRNDDESMLIGLAVPVGMSQSIREAVEELDRRAWGSQALRTATGWEYSAFQP